MAQDFDNAWENGEQRYLVMDIARISESIPDSCSKIFIVAKKYIKCSMMIFDI